MLDRIKEYITYILLAIIFLLFVINNRSIKRELKHYKKELETLEKETIKVIQDNVEDLKRRNEELENGNSRLENQLMKLRTLQPKDACLTSPINEELIKLLRDADI